MTSRSRRKSGRNYSTIISVNRFAVIIILFSMYLRICFIQTTENLIFLGNAGSPTNHLLTYIIYVCVN